MPGTILIKDPQKFAMLTIQQIKNTFHSIALCIMHIGLTSSMMTCSNRRNVYPQQYRGMSPGNMPAELHEQCTAIEYIVSGAASKPPTFLLVVDLCVDAHDLQASAGHVIAPRLL